MTEIDDAYQEETEIIEQEFFENAKSSKDREALVKQYRKDMERARQRFTSQYEKFMKKEMKKVQNPKKKKEKKETFKHLEVKHFDLNLNRWGRFKVSWSLFWFNWSRRYHKFLAFIFPNWFLYLYYKITIAIKSAWRETRRFIDNIWAGFKKWFIKITLKFWAGIVHFSKLFITLLKKGLSKISFWKKKTKEGEGETKEEKSKEEGETQQKEGEVKDEKEAG